MIFHSIDSKLKCKSIIANKTIIKKPDYDKLTGSWDYHPDHSNDDICYAQLYLGGKSIDESCPPHLSDEWQRLKYQHNSFIKSFITAQVKAQDYCFYDLIPETFIKDYFGHKCEIIEYILQNYPAPKNYNFLFNLSKVLKEIECKKLNFNYGALTSVLHKYKARRFNKKLLKLHPFISYNIFGTITGRLTTKKDSFPILTLDKEYRSILEPSNKYFIELDFNGAELRCLLALNNTPQPEKDIHQWHHQHISKIYKHQMDRDAVKRKIFAWLYGGPEVSLGMPKIEQYYNKNQVLDKYWDGTKIINPFGREIECDKFRALNFLIQSTTSDLFLRRAVEINKLLKGRNSKIAALIHDSILIDFDVNDKDILEDLIQEFGNTDLGTFKVNARLGTNFGNMRKFR